MNTRGAEGGGSAGGKRRRRTPPGPSREGERRRRRAPAAAAPACASRRWPVRVGMERERERPMGRGRGGQRGAGRGRAPPSCQRAAAEVRSPPGGRRRPGRRRVGRDRERMGRGACFFFGAEAVSIIGFAGFGAEAGGGSKRQWRSWLSAREAGEAAIGESWSMQSVRRIKDRTDGKIRSDVDTLASRAGHNEFTL